MEKRNVTGSEIDRLLRGDLSDIEDLVEDDEEDDEELFGVSEDVLAARLDDFQQLLDENEVNLNEVSNIDLYDEDIHNDSQPPAGEQNPPEPVEHPQQSDEDEYPHENEPLYNRLPDKDRKLWRKQRNIKRWKDITADGNNFDVLETQLVAQTPPQQVRSPKQYFNMFIDDSIIQNMVQQTNLYSVQKRGRSISTTFSEMEQYLGIHMITSIVKMPAYRMYWSEGSRYAQIADVMSRNRFDVLRANLHINDNTNIPDGNDPDHDKLFKVRPFLDSVRENMRKVPLDDKVSVDELIIPFKGRSHMKQYNPKKPHKWGIKVFGMASKCGIIHDFEIYVGKGTVKQIKLGISGDIVMRLVEVVPRGLNYKLFIDNWFNSHILLCTLKQEGILAVGTIRSDRIGGCPLKPDKALLAEGRGSIDLKIDTDNGIIACKWADNKTVCLASNYIGSEPVDEVPRWSTSQKKRIPVQRPAIVKEYNGAMGGVDLHDMLVELYRINVKVKRYYLRIVMHLIDMCTVNAWLVYRRDLSIIEPNSKHMPLVKFKVSVANALIGESNVKKRGRPASGEQAVRQRRRYTVAPKVPDEARLDSKDHWPIPVDIKKRCKKCINGYSKFKCSKCETFLCLTQKRNCFVAYHCD